MDRTIDRAPAPSVRATYALSADDVAHAYQLHNRALLWRWRTLAVASCALTGVGAAVAVASGGDPIAIIVAVTCGAVGAILLPLFMIRFVVPARARRRYALSPTLAASLAMEADAAAVRFRAVDGEVSTPWHDVPRFREDAHVVLLYQSPIIFHVVPKRVLAAGESEVLRAFHEAGRLGGRPDDLVPGGGSATNASWPERGPWEAPALATSATWTVTLDHIVAAKRLHLRWRWRQPRAAALPMFLAACTAIIVASGHDDASPLWIGAAALEGAAFVVAFRVLLYATLPIWKRNAVREQPNLGHLWRVELDKHGCRAMTAHQDLRTPWSTYVAWGQDERVALVYRSDILFQFIPVRAVDEAFLATFRELAGALPRR